MMKRKLLNLLTLALLLAACSKTENTATISTGKMNANWWKERHEKILQSNKELDPQLILVGNSITHSLDNEKNKEFWENYLDAYNTVNMGFSGDRTENVIWRLENGELEGINPKVATLMIGTNNLDGNNYEEITEPEDLAEAIWKICSIINQKLPDTEIALLGIFPYGWKPEIHRNRLIQETNAIISNYPTKNDKIHYFNIGYVLEDEGGTVKGGLMPDFLHPNTEGYRLIFKALAPEIEKLIK